MLNLGHRRLLALVFGLLLLGLAAFPSSTFADDPTATELARQSLPSTTGTILHGGWVAYRLAYPGGFARVDVTLAYDPSDDPNDRGLVNGGQMTLAVYSPSAPPPSGEPIGWAVGNLGEKRYRVEAEPGGEYIVIVNNWDSLGRPLNFTLNATREDGSAVSGEGEESLTFVSASETPTEVRKAEAGLAVGSAGVAPNLGVALTGAGQTGRRVGIQAGHWETAQLPDELARLRTSTGTSGGGVPEWRLNLDVARRVAALLEAEGIAADVLPSTIPPGYTADAFVALHADGDYTGRFSGFKLAHGRWSGDPVADQALLDAIALEYGVATNLAVDSHVSRNMTGYYAFSNRRFQHAVAPGTPAVILEMGFMTNTSDLRFLLGNTDVVAGGIARGIVRFLDRSQ